MTEPIQFAETTRRYSIPLLHPAQAQKEFTINEGHALIDALLHPTIMGIASSPPATPADGDAWIVGDNAQDSWAGKENSLALHHGSAWLYLVPHDGLRVFDASIAAYRTFLGEWVAGSTPSEPSGGSTVDQEARAAIAEVIASLRTAGIIPQI